MILYMILESWNGIQWSWPYLVGIKAQLSWVYVICVLKKLAIKKYTAQTWTQLLDQVAFKLDMPLIYKISYSCHFYPRD